MLFMNLQILKDLKVCCSRTPRDTSSYYTACSLGGSKLSWPFPYPLLWWNISNESNSESCDFSHGLSQHPLQLGEKPPYVLYLTSILTLLPFYCVCFIKEIFHFVESGLLSLLPSSFPTEWIRSQLMIICYMPPLLPDHPSQAARALGCIPWALLIPCWQLAGPFFLPFCQVYCLLAGQLWFSEFFQKEVKIKYLAPNCQWAVFSDNPSPSFTTSIPQLPSFSLHKNNPIKWSGMALSYKKALLALGRDGAKNQWSVSNAKPVHSCKQNHTPWPASPLPVNLHLVESKGRWKCWDMQSWHMAAPE